MDRERLMKYCENLYLPKREMLSRIPIGTSLDDLWQEIVSRRRSRAVQLPMSAPGGERYWFVVTDSMISASEKIVEEAMLPYEKTDMAVLEEAFYTSFLEGSSMTADEAMTYVKQNGPPQDIQEQMLQNNRSAIAYVAENAYRPLSEEMICSMAAILTSEMDGGGGILRESQTHVIPSMGSEHYTVPCPEAIPDMLREFVAYLSDVNIHPLLKAAVAHAWFMVVRPFNEGNERLARLVSAMVLLRAKYSFFTEISISALIAQDGYGYYDSVADVLREGSSGDWTYMVDFYISILGKAVDELRRRREMNKAELTRQALPSEPGESILPASRDIAEEKYSEEAEGEQSGSELNLDAPETEEEPKEEEESTTDESVEEILEKAGFISLEMTENDTKETEKTDTGQFTLEEIEERLRRMIAKPTKLYSAVGERLLDYLKRERYTFTRTELLSGILEDTKNSTRSYNIISYLRSRDLIFSYEEIKNRIMVYRLNVREDEPPQVSASTMEGARNYSQKVLDMIDRLANAKWSHKDKRIGRILLEKLNTGYVDFSDYRKMNETGRWKRDMKFCTMTGLVSKETDERYLINPELQPSYDLMANWQKCMATELYDAFGRESFTSEMIMANLDYSQTMTSATLHTFTLIGILDCTEGANNSYQFLVTPDERPECFGEVA